MENLVYKGGGQHNFLELETIAEQQAVQLGKTITKPIVDPTEKDITNYVETISKRIGKHGASKAFQEAVDNHKRMFRQQGSAKSLSVISFFEKCLEKIND
tara:strand:- start:10600 stop:10899 length:300 start_codon:yes stop_codon:yes gene_type:complete